jgi:hypothetical protein
MIADNINSQASASDFFFDIQSTYGGTASIVGGAHQSGGGDFFKTAGGSLDQDNPAITVRAVTGVPDSDIKASGYITAVNEATTTIAAQDVPVVVAGTWIAGVEKRFTVSSAGVFTYTGLEDATIPIVAKLQITPTSGTNREYDIHLRINGSTLDLASRDTVRVDAGNPGKAILVTDLNVSNGDYFEIVITATNSTQNVTASAVTLVVE